MKAIIFCLEGLSPSGPTVLACLPESVSTLTKPFFLRKEVIQPHLPVRLPCYDLAPITCFTLGRPSRSRTSGAPGFHGLTGGVYKARERIHPAMLMRDY